MLIHVHGLKWKQVSDFVNPFGDSRGNQFQTVLILDLNKDSVTITKKDGSYWAPLGIARERLLTWDDFKAQQPSAELNEEHETLQGPYWEPAIEVDSRKKAFLGRVLRDLAHAWRHVLRRPMNAKTFLKFAYAIIWISTNDIIIHERTGFRCNTGLPGPHISVMDLPRWKTPDKSFVKVGKSWFVLAQDINSGLDMVNRHVSEESSTRCSLYVVLTVRQVVLCKADKASLVWTKPETLFDSTPASDAAIDAILWAATDSVEPTPNAIHSLPIEIQDRIMHFATISFVASARLGCELGLGSSFTWLEGRNKIEAKLTKKHRFESSPVESMIMLNGTMSGLVYQRERK
jgi:hypothetical protein